MSLRVIAEIGVNWQGDMRLAQDLILEARRAGASAAKFQLYSATALFGPYGESPNPAVYRQVGWMDDVDYRQMWMLKEFCGAVGIEFSASVFDEERLNWLEAAYVESHKIASRLVKYNPALCRQILSTGKPTYVSLGMWRPLHGPVRDRPRGERDWPFPEYNNAEYLYCVSKYPTPLADLRFPYDFRMAGYTGFSDHTQGVEAALIAVAKGAKVIEKHFTLDKSFPGPDHSCSATPDELRHLVEVGGRIEAALREMEGAEDETISKEFGG